MDNLTDDPHLLHMAINMNLNLLSCDQIRACSILKRIKEYDFNLSYRIKGLLDASTLFKCVEINKKSEFTLKIIPNQAFNDFIEIYLNSSDIDAINRIVNIVQEKQFVFILFESAYDDLHSYLKERIRLDENELAKLFRQIVEIVHNLHRRCIYLNDLKLRKFVFIDLNRSKLKLENLDGAKQLNDKLDLKDKFGCILYQAPERLIDNLDTNSDTKSIVTKSDCWSLGVILYTLAFGKYPFHHFNLDVLKDQILNSSPFKLPFKNATKIDSLVTCLLNKNPVKRLDTSEILTKLAEAFEANQEWRMENWLIGEGKNENSINQNLKSEFKINLPSSSNLSSKEYYLKLTKLIKLTRTSIRKQAKHDELDVKLDDDIPIVHYRLNRIYHCNH